jgi:hypothetical protein
VRRLVLGHAGEKLHLRALERVGDERRERPRRHRQLDPGLGGPGRDDAREQVAPPGHRFAPAARELLVREPGGPELPEDAHVARAEVLAEVTARRAPFLGERLVALVEGTLPREQAGVLLLEQRGEERPLAAEVVVDEREAHVRPVGDGAGGRACVAVVAEKIARRVQDLGASRVPARDPLVDR